MATKKINQKMQLRHFIEHLYEEWFGKKQPDTVMSIEELASVQDAKKAARKMTKLSAI
jgi:hypothetical protein